MPSDDYIRDEFINIEINKCDACISKLPTKDIRLFKDALTTHYNKALKSGKYMQEFVSMIRKYETFLLQDEIQSNNDSNAVVNCAKKIKEILF